MLCKYESIYIFFIEIIVEIQNVTGIKTMFITCKIYIFQLLLMFINSVTIFNKIKIKIFTEFQQTKCSK